MTGNENFDTNATSEYRKQQVPKDERIFVDKRQYHRMVRIATAIPLPIHVSYKIIWLDLRGMLRLAPCIILKSIFGARIDCTCENSKLTTYLPMLQLLT